MHFSLTLSVGSRDMRAARHDQHAPFRERAADREGAIGLMIGASMVLTKLVDAASARASGQVASAVTTGMRLLEAPPVA